MAEGRRTPHGGIVARCAIVVEVAKHMIRIRWLSKLRCMARIAIRVHKLIIAVRMALNTLRRDVHTRQRKIRRGMIKCCRLPGCLRVTLCAIVIELSRDVVRICCRVEGRCVAIPARHPQTLELVIDVAQIAGNCLMRSNKRECCIRMAEGRRTPHGGIVARCAVMVEIPKDVIGICRLSKLRRMARIAIRVH